MNKPPLQRAWLRSTVFNLAFLSTNLVCCIVLLPALLLPRPTYMRIIKGYLHLMTALEYGILGLRYEIRGRQHLPKDTSYLVAAKHMSLYETFKLHALFGDPAIILKQELVNIPLWGLFLKKSDVIAIDRSTPEAARKSMTNGALRMKDQDRPIVIFPQGTRVWPHETAEQKPYKRGIHTIQEATELPIIPMATNSGLFWPRSGWLKSGGTVIFAFSRPITAGLDKKTCIKTLQTILEEESLSLMNEAKMNDVDRKPWGIRNTVALLLILATTYICFWFIAAHQVKAAYTEFMTELGHTELTEKPTITGFPGALKLDVFQEKIARFEGDLEVNHLHIEGWPLPFMPIHISTGPIALKAADWSRAIIFDSFEGRLKLKNNIITVLKSTLKQNEFVTGLNGTIDLHQEPVPKIDVILDLEHYENFIIDLAAMKIIKPRVALFLSAGFATLADEEGIAHVPIYQREQTLYAGPLPLTQIPASFQ